jgi:hypothetical protein
MYPKFNANKNIIDTITRVNVIKHPFSDIEQYFQTNYEVLQFDNGFSHNDNDNDNDKDNENTNDISNTIVSYEIINNTVYKLYKSKDYQEYQFSNEITFHLHKEDDITRKEVYTIPLNLQYTKKEFRKYKLHSKSLVTLIVESSNNVNKLIFEINEIEITESIKEELITFLSILKLYK